VGLAGEYILQDISARMAEIEIKMDNGTVSALEQVTYQELVCKGQAIRKQLDEHDAMTHKTIKKQNVSDGRCKHCGRISSSGQETCNGCGAPL
jgi:hypothetical protein